VIAGEVDVGGEDDVGFSGGDQAEAFGAEDSFLGGRVDVDEFGVVSTAVIAVVAAAVLSSIIVAIIVIVGRRGVKRMKHHNLLFVVKAIPWIGPETIGQREAEAIVKAFGGRPARFGDVPE